MFRRSSDAVTWRTYATLQQTYATSADRGG